ncbi:MAG TPA: DUF4872 domain-containing protein [Gemmataceae bacterium]|nr:DUF4872 domain-containing protein [Gemmataceae bacterium]
MTVRKHFKQLVRARMGKTGESYATARRHILRQADPTTDVPWHFPGNVPATTALRVLLTAAGVRDPHTGGPFSEAMLYGIAGGVGIGVFSFLYEKENFASFFVAGHHLFHDHRAYLTGVLGRFGIKPVVHETTSPKAAAAALRDALASGPCVAWVDKSHLPHRGLPSHFSGSGYHIVAIYRQDADGTALIGDLTDRPVAVPGPALAEARGRIKKDRHRLLSIPPSASRTDLAPLVRAGLRACHRGLTGEGGVKSARANFSLEALARWADRLHGSAGKESWERVFAPGPRLWRGLTSIPLFVEYWGTGGGLGRPLFAEFLTEAADALTDTRLEALADRYAELGRQWSALADAALPADVPEFREARELFARIGELTNSGGRPDEIRDAWRRLEELQGQAGAKFPMPDADCAALRAELQRRVRGLYEAEVAAHAELGRVAG